MVRLYIPESRITSYNVCYTKLLRAIIPWLRIIIVSGYDDFDLARQAIGIGVDHYILKPVSNRDLFSALRLSAQKITEYKRQSVFV